MHLTNILPILALLLPPLSLTANITVSQPNTPYVPAPYPSPAPFTQSSAILALFSRLGRTTTFNLVSRIHLEGDTGEPEGMVVIHSTSSASVISRIFVARGDWTTPMKSYGNHTIINGTDRSNGAGYAHLVVYDGSGSEIADATLTSEGDEEYHIGGIDYDGERVWGTLAQYRPNATATVIRIDPGTLEYERVIRVGDHLGGIVHDRRTERVACLNWGSRNASYFDLGDLGEPVREERAGVEVEFVKPQKVVRNPSYYVDYQDCKFLGHHETMISWKPRALMICSGVATLANNVTIGGVAIVDVESMVPLMEVPLTMESDLGRTNHTEPF